MSTFKKILSVFLILSVMFTITASAAISWKAFFVSTSLTVDDQTGTTPQSVFQANSTSIDFGTIPVTATMGGEAIGVVVSVTNMDTSDAQQLYISILGYLAPNIHIRFYTDSTYLTPFTNATIVPAGSTILVYPKVSVNAPSASDPHTVTVYANQLKFWNTP